MKHKDLKIDFRYLSGNIACLSVDSISGESVHNDINNEEAIIIFNSLVGEKENCQTVKTLLKENQELKKQLEKKNGTQIFIDTQDMEERYAEGLYQDYLKEENERLKKHLEVPEHCNLKTLEDYKSYYEDTTKEKILEDTYIDYCAYVNLAHRYSELKKQLENLQETHYLIQGGRSNGKTYLMKLQQDNDKYKNQQKEFIEYLENMIKAYKEPKLTLNCHYTDLEVMQLKVDFLEEILSKYKEIIGAENGAR